MTFAKLNIPVLVRNVSIENRPHFHVRPLFIPYPESIKRRYGEALDDLRKQVEEGFSKFTISKENADQLLWFMFCPSVTQESVPLEFRLGRHHINGIFSAVHFTLKGHTFVTLPAFDNYMFMVPEGQRNKRRDIRPLIGEFITNYLKRQKDMAGDDFAPDDYYAAAGESVALLEAEVYVEQGPTKFEAVNPLDALFSQMQAPTDFDGHTEIQRMGMSLNSLYPERLGVAFLREPMLARVRQALFEGPAVSTVIVGEEGTGRHTLVHHALREYIEASSKDRRIKRQQQIWLIDPNRIVSGMSITGDWERRMESVIDFVRQPAGEEKPDKIMFDNPVALLSAGKSGSGDMAVSHLLKPYIEQRLLHVLLLATPDEWKVMQARDRAFSDLFQVIRLHPTDEITTVGILLAQRTLLERKYETTVSIHAIEEIIKLQRNYLSHQALPGSLVKLLLQLANKHKYGVVDMPEVKEEFSTITGLQESVLDASQALSREALRFHLQRQILGQEAAVSALVDVVELMKARLLNKGRPVASLLFAGPTGVGKTEAAKVLARYLSGNDKHLIRFDMNEYGSGDALSRLIGHAGQPNGQLTEKVRQRPFGILLLDEIEKAHYSVRDLLLQVLDDGRLTDYEGKTTNFANLIIILTSNVGATEVGKSVSFQAAGEDAGHTYRRAIERAFRPEFINRIDRVVVFERLRPEHIQGIARLQIKGLLQRDGFVRRSTLLNIDHEALNWIAERGYDPAMGGRALNRQLERDLTSPSADQLLAMTDDQPAIFDIRLKDNALYPSIRTLSFVEAAPPLWLSDIQDLKDGRTFLKKLLRALAIADASIKAQYEGSGSLITQETQYSQWRYFDLTDQIASLTEQINNSLLGYGGRYIEANSATPLRVKSGTVIPRHQPEKINREHLKDRLFNAQALADMADAHKYGSFPYDGAKSRYMDYFLRVLSIWATKEGFVEGCYDKVIITFSYCTNSVLSSHYMLDVTDMYGSLLSDMGIDHEFDEPEGNVITAQGYGLYRLLKSEEGLLMFYFDQDSPVPVQVSVRLAGAAPASGEHLPPVIRIFDRHIMSDLRTNTSCVWPIDGQEFKLLLFGGFYASEPWDIPEIERY